MRFGSFANSMPDFCGEDEVSVHGNSLNCRSLIVPDPQPLVRALPYIAQDEA